MLNRKNLKYPFLMLIGAGSYGFTPTLLKFSYSAGFTPTMMTNMQYTLAATILWLLTLVSFRKQRFPKQNLQYIIAIGLTGAACAYCYFRSLTELTASLAIVLLFQFAWIVMVIDILVTKRLPAMEKWIGMLLIILGTFLAVGLLHTKINSIPSLTSIGFGLLSGFFYALSLYLYSYAGSESTPLPRTTITVTISALSTLIIFPPTYLSTMHQWSSFLTWGMLLALSGQIIPVLLLHQSIPHIGGRMAGVLGTIELPVAVLTARFVLGELVDWTKWVGIFLIILGMVVSEMKIRQILRKQKSTSLTNSLP